MNIGGYHVTPLTAALAIAGALWVLTLLAGILSWEKGRGAVRKTDIVVLVVSVIAGGIWMFALMPRTAGAAPEAGGRKRTATCALVEVGQTEEQVKARLGEPDEIRGEEELRGPASNVWIYRDSRCAVHFFGNRVESIE